MSVYYFTIATLSVMGYVFTVRDRQEKTKVFYLAAAFLALTFIASFRYGIGFDYFSYEQIYVSFLAWQDVLSLYSC